MSNTQRPTIANKAAKAKAQMEDELDQGLSIKIDGREYTARIGDVTPEINRELRANIGFGFLDLIATASRTPDNDLISAFVWVARRIDGEHIAFDAVSISYAQILDESTEINLPGQREAGEEDPEKA